MLKIFTNSHKLLDYLDLVKDKFYFRGFKYCSQMIPTLGRKPSLVKAEFEMIHIITNSEEINAFTNIHSVQHLFEYLQHYSFSTRLLDWSMDPKIALYFSIFEKLNVYTNKITYIACLPKDTGKFPDISELNVYESVNNDYSTNNLGNMGPIRLSNLCEFGWNTYIDDLHKYLDIAELVFGKLIEITPNVSLLPYHPDIENQNKETQKGVFTLQKNPETHFPRVAYDLLVLKLGENEKTHLLSKLKEDFHISDSSLFSKEKKYIDLDMRCKAMVKWYSECATCKINF